MAVIKEENYHDEQNKNNILKLRKVLDTLPPFCRDFFRGIEPYTSTRTRLAYAYDIRLFFEFLHETNSFCKKREITELPLSVLDMVQRTDIEEYLDYMSLYQKDGKDITNEERGKARKLAALRSFYNYYFQSERIEKNTAALVPLPKRLCDSKGKVLETLVTDSAGHAESKNYPVATFKNGQYKKAITYILKETKTLDGYQLDETEHKIQFEYVNDRTPVIEYTLDLTNKKAPEKDTPETSENQEGSTPGSHGSDATSVSNSPKTGDNTNIAIFVLTLAVSAGCLGTVVAVKRERK